MHGPQPRSYAQRTPKKMKAAALRGALSDRARHGRVHVVSGFVDGDAPRTKDALAVLAAVTGDGRGDVPCWSCCDRDDELTWQEPAQRRRVSTCSTQDQLNTYDVLVSDHVVFTAEALDGVREPRLAQQEAAQ